MRECLILRGNTVEKDSPLIGMHHEVFVDIFEIKELACSIELPVDVWPLVIRNPFGWIRRHCDFSRRSWKKIPPFFVINFVIALFDFDCEYKWKQKFMFLEQWSADILVERVSEVVVHVCQSLIKHIACRTVLHTHHKESNEPLQWVLVHRIDQREVDDAEEKERSSVSHWSVAFSCFVDLFLGDFAFLYSLVDFCAGPLRVRKLVDERLIF